MNITRAIRLLRPQFAERERLRESLKKLHGTYINTIPQDVIDIISSMVPLLQVGPEFMQTEYERYIEFSDKYQIIEDGVRKTHAGGEQQYMDRNKLIRDFPEHALMFMNRRVSIKWIDDKLYVNDDDNVNYAGQHYCVCNSDNDHPLLLKLKNPDGVKTLTHPVVYVKRVLPCGLAIGVMNRDIKMQFLMDFECEDYILVDLPIHWTGILPIMNMMDDYGNIHPYKNTDDAIAGLLGEQFGMFLRIILE